MICNGLNSGKSGSDKDERRGEHSVMVTYEENWLSKRGAKTNSFFRPAKVAGCTSYKCLEHDQSMRYPAIAHSEQMHTVQSRGSPQER